MYMARLTLILDKSQITELKELAKKDGRTLSEFLYLSGTKKYNRDELFKYIDEQILRVVSERMPVKP